jgi:hypothetical protein
MLSSRLAQINSNVILEEARLAQIYDVLSEINGVLIDIKNKQDDRASQARDIDDKLGAILSTLSPDVLDALHGIEQSLVDIKIDVNRIRYLPPSNREPQ